MRLIEHGADNVQQCAFNNFSPGSYIMYWLSLRVIEQLRSGCLNIVNYYNLYLLRIGDGQSKTYQRKKKKKKYCHRESREFKVPAYLFLAFQSIRSSNVHTGWLGLLGPSFLLPPQYRAAHPNCLTNDSSAH